MSKKKIGVVCEMQKLIFNNADVNVTMCQRRICAELWCVLFTTHVVLWSGRVYLSRTTAYADVHHVLLCYEEADVHHVLLCVKKVGGCVFLSTCFGRIASDCVIREETL